MKNEDAICQLADHVAGLRFDDLSKTAIQFAKTFSLDTFGVAIAGTNGPFVNELMEAATGWGYDSAAGVWGNAARLSAPSAAMINAYQAHNSEYDAIHEKAVVHPLASILGAMLAVLERDGGVDGRTLLTAVTAGVDVSCSIGMASTKTLSFFRPATAGSFGAVAALGKIAGFEREQLVHAFGLQLGQIAGTMQAHEEGSPLLGMQLGFCTRAAVTSFDLAARGVTGPKGVLEGSHGYYALFEGGCDVAVGFEGLGQDWRICGVSHKPFPSGRATHGAIDGLLKLSEAHSIDVKDIQRVLVEVPPLVYQLTGRPMIDDPGVNYARLCIPYVGAVALRRGDVGINDFAPHSLRDPETRALASRIEVIIRDHGDPNALVPQRATVRLSSGQEYTTDISEVIGSPSNPLTSDRHLSKFRRNWINGARPLKVEAGETMIEMIDGLEDVGDCRELTKLMIAN